MIKSKIQADVKQGQSLKNRCLKLKKRAKKKVFIISFPCPLIREKNEAKSTFQK